MPPPFRLRAPRLSRPPVGLLLVVLGAVLGPPRVGAQDQEALEVSVEETGRCGSGIPLEVGLGVDCFFDLDPRTLPEATVFGADGDWDEFASFSVQAGDYFGSCHVISETVVCPDVGQGTYRSTGRVEVQLFYNGTPVSTSTLALVDNSASSLYISIGFDEPVVFAGNPLRTEVFLSSVAPAVYLNLRERNGSEVLETIRLPTAEAGRVRTSGLELDLPIGRYRAWPCVGFYPETCVEQTGGWPFQVIAGQPLELLAGHNRPSAQRINVLFVGSDLGGSDVAEIARTMLTVDGPVDTGFDLRYGPMAIEPLASNIDKFNFWYLADDLGSELSLVGAADAAGQLLAGFDLPNVQVTALYGGGSNSDARATSFYGRTSVPAVDSMVFGGARVSIDPSSAIDSATTLAHEWGHALFELRDEYYGFDGRAVETAYPNCAPDAGTAELWWGEHRGRVDPFVYQVLQDREAAGLEAESADLPLVELVRIDVVAGGCYGNWNDATAYRPSRDSLMNSEIPVFGHVNRARVEAVLDRFSGRGPLVDPDDMVVSCISQSNRLTCDGVLAPYLDPPLDALLVEGTACLFDVTVDPVAVSCSAPAPSGSATVLTVGDEWRRVSVTRLEPAPPPTRVDESGGAATDDGDRRSEGSMVGFWLLIGGSVGGAALLVGLGRRRRESTEPPA